MSGTQDYPDVRQLWDRIHIAAKEYRCDSCGDIIPVGERYRSIGCREDGVFQHTRWHPGDPLTHCPRFAEAEKRALAEQFEGDRARYFPSEGPSK